MCDGEPPTTPFEKNSCVVCFDALQNAVRVPQKITGRSGQKDSVTSF